MDNKRAIEILTPDATRYTPAEYEEALTMAREALQVKMGTWEEREVECDSAFLRRRFYCSACGGWNTHGKSKRIYKHQHEIWLFIGSVLFGVAMHNPLLTSAAWLIGLAVMPREG